MNQFLDVKGYEGLYKISTNGKVYSLKRKKIKRTDTNRNGYESVNLFKNGRGKHFLVHRLVAQAFIPNPNNYSFVNHIDGNKLNNDVNNLEWCTWSQNMIHAYSHGLVKPLTTKVIQYTLASEKVKEWDSIKEACDTLGISHGNISKVCCGKRKRAGGYIWRYKE